jgi:hypothetical protein
VRFGAREQRFLPVIGLLIGVQSLCLYASVARLPVALALLAFNTYPLWAALWSALLYRQRPERAMLWAMPVVLFGLALALDVLGAAWGVRPASGAASAQGVAFAAGGRGHLRAGPRAHAARGLGRGRARAPPPPPWAWRPSWRSAPWARKAASSSPRPRPAGQALAALTFLYGTGLHHHVHRAAAPGRGRATRPS